MAKWWQAWGDFEQTPAYSARARSPPSSRRESRVLPVSAINRLNVPDEDHQLPEQKWPLPPRVSAHSYLPWSSDDRNISLNECARILKVNVMVLVIAIALGAR